MLVALVASRLGQDGIDAVPSDGSTLWSAIAFIPPVLAPHIVPAGTWKLGQTDLKLPGHFEGLDD